MCQTFTGGRAAIVTANAIVRDAVVIKSGWRPGDRRVAVVASITTADVRCCFAGCSRAIVARFATSVYCRVIEKPKRGPRDGRVTIGTKVTALHMIDWFCRRVTYTTVTMATYAGRRGVYK